MAAETDRPPRSAAETALAHLPAALSAALCLWFTTFSRPVSDGVEFRLVFDWLPALDVAAAFRLDGLSLAFALLVTGVGALVLLYAPAYLGRDPRLWRLLGLLGLFEIAMLGSCRLQA
jgi:NADH:ubiquinone oxidoreductase subunit 5 (chain L)/Multisubunit Na+/H+ antiporter, MnhA subunit